MKKTVLLSLVILISALSLTAQQAAPASAELTGLLNEFLAGAAKNDALVHDRFWADDLIYTRSAGQRITKAELMKGVRSAKPAQPGEPGPVYAAEDVRIQQYGNAAVVAFRLVSTTKNAGQNEVSEFLNTGTFIKRNGKWQVVAWQATAIPKPQTQTTK